MLFVMNMEIECIRISCCFTFRLDAAICFKEDEIIIGSSAAALTRSFPNNVIMHPLKYLSDRRCNPNCNAGVVCLVSCFESRRWKWKGIFLSFASRIPIKSNASVWSVFSWSASVACIVWRLSRVTVSPP